MKILCLGDSWTDPNYPEYEGIKTWAQYFDADIHASSGCSNDWIFDSFCRFHEQYDQIIILWSEWHRQGMQDMAHSWSKTHDIFTDILKTPNYMYVIDKIRGKSAFQMQGPAMLGYPTIEEEQAYGRLACQYIIERNLSIPIHGSPAFEEIGGFHCKSLLNKHFPHNSWKLSSSNGHPNQKGHSFLYEYIHKQISS